jgi:hypothetical protein
MFTVEPISQTHNPLMRLLPLLKASARLKASGKDIASAVKMTPAGVHYALVRIAEGRPGRSPKA